MIKTYRLVRLLADQGSLKKGTIVELMWNTSHGWRGRILEKDAPETKARDRQFWSDRPYEIIKDVVAR